jgi:hypothetical protein
MTVNFKLIGEPSLSEGCALLAKRLGIGFCDSGIPLYAEGGADALSIGEKDGGYKISYGERTEFFRGLALLSGSLREKKAVALCEKRRFKTCGVMFDLSRSAVYTKETVFGLLEAMACMGLDMLMLYTEDVYELEKYPDFGYLRGAYTEAEIREMDARARTFGIELIPCIQTLAHLRAALRWPSLSGFADTADILMSGEGAESYALIEEMFKVSAASFTSRKIHIGFDEAESIGRGKYLLKNGFETTADVYFAHLKRVCELAKKYGFTPMIWNDMIFKLEGDHRFLIEEPEKMCVPKENYERYPENLELVYYNYGGPYRSDPKHTGDYLLDFHKRFNRYTHFAGGIWTWTRLIPGLKKTYEVTKLQLNSCEKYGTESVFACVWGCGQHSFDLRATLPGMQIWAELLYRADADMALVWERFGQCTGYNAELWKNLYFDDFSDEELEKYLDTSSYCINPSYQHLYNDILTGMLDKTLSGYDFKPRYRAFADALSEMDEKEISLFERYKALYELLFVKCDIGIRLRRAYKDGDKEEMARVLADMKNLPALYDAYHVCVENDWYSQYKPFGYSGQDMSLGMIEARVKTAIRVVEKYLAGEMESLPELEAEIRYFYGIEKPLTEVGYAMGFMSSSVFEINM